MRSRPGEARTILRLHIISARPSKQPLMVRTFLKVYMELGSCFFLLSSISVAIPFRLLGPPEIRSDCDSVAQSRANSRPRGIRVCFPRSCVAEKCAQFCCRSSARVCGAIGARGATPHSFLAALLPTRMPRRAWLAVPTNAPELLAAAARAPFKTATETSKEAVADGGGGGGRRMKV